MDVDQHQVTLDGSPVLLSLRGFRLLEVLMRSPGQLLTREQLIDRMRGAGSRWRPEPWMPGSPGARST